MMPSDEQMEELVAQRIEHSKHCQYQPTYDLTRKGRIKLNCYCGWCFVLESGNNDVEV